MRPIRYFLGFCVCLGGAVLASQIPEFEQQYFQRLGGAVDELNLVVEHFDEDSRQFGYDVTGALGVMSKNPEQLVRDQAGRMSDNIARRDRLRDQQEAMASGGIGEFDAFVMKFDRQLAGRAWGDFKFAVPITVEGAIFALCGFGIPALFLFAGGAVRKRAVATA